MKTKIYCIQENGKHQFYVSAYGNDYYLFSQDYRKGVENFYSKPQTYDEATNFSKAKRDFSIMNTMKKIPSYVRYIEKYYEIILTNKSQKRATTNKYSRAYAWGWYGNKESHL